MNQYIGGTYGHARPASTAAFSRPGHSSETGARLSLRGGQWSAFTVASVYNNPIVTRATAA